jgi:hypothetical protein
MIERDLSVAQELREGDDMTPACGSMRTTPAALPTLGELSFDLLGAAATSPWLLDRFQRRHGFFQDRFGSDKLRILDPQFGPAIDRRQFARRSGKIKIFGDARNPIGAQNISQMADHQGIFCAVNPLHYSSIALLSHAAAPLLLTSKLLRARENAPDDLHNCRRSMDGPTRLSLAG